MAEPLQGRTTADWLTGFAKSEIPAAPVHETSALLHDPHLESVGFFSVHDTTVGTLRFPGMPASFSVTPGQITSPAPVLGQDGRAVLTEAGFSADEVAALAACGALILPCDKPAQQTETG